jgi:hypothetical protein
VSQGFLDEGLDQVIGIMALATGVVIVLLIGGALFFAFEGYKSFQHRHDPPGLGPWGEPADPSAFGWDAGLHMGEEVVWS